MTRRGMATASQLIAHRGYARHYPENTIVAVDAAVDAGATFIEVDVQLSKDAVPVLFHDRTLKRLCGVDSAVHSLTLTELKQLHPSDTGRFGDRFRDIEIATLAEFRTWLKAHADVTAFVEIKRVSIEQFGVEPVLSAAWRELSPAVRQCVLISYSLPTLAAARRQGWPRIGAVIDHWRERRQAQMREIRPDFLFCAVDGLPRFGPLTHDAAQIAVFEIDNPDLAKKLARRGARYIETFAIGEMAAGLRGVTAS